MSSLPSSYSSLPFRDISVSHVPASCSTPTKVILVTLNRPNKYNAATEGMLIELVRVYELFSKDDRVKAIVMTGAGNAFCAGADLDVGFSKLLANKSNEALANAFRDRGGLVSLAIYNCPKPTIMAINGPAAGFGLTVTLPATIRVACATAKVGLPFARRGLTMEACSSFFLPRLVGHSKALHLAVTGATYLASDPMVNMLFSELLPTPEETVSRALAIADDIAANTSLISTKLMRDLMFHGPSTAEETHVLDSRVFLAVVGSKDNEEGIKSFREKRRPVFNDTVENGIPSFWPWWISGGGLSLSGDKFRPDTTKL